MRVKFSFALVMALGIALVATAAFAAPGGNPGKPDDKGKSASAPGHNKEAESKHDPSNPDGTYQGKSPSTPDQDGIGADHGIDNNDKTGEGTDGNNGCGNDPDREDDNNGWCGKPPEVSPTTTPTTRPTTTPTTTPTTNPIVAPNVTVSPSVQTQVLGNKITRTEVAAQGLAQTGQDMRLLIAAGIMILAMGLGIRAIRKQTLA